jgi:UTP--glucose-1-phosphate uridylyltransferase
MKRKIKKAVIPVAGFGTRLLPATKSQPKEMLPIVDKPAVQYVVEEAVQSEIEDLLFVTGRGKRAIEDYFDYAVELETELELKGKFDLLEQVRSVCEKIKIYYVRQKMARGLGDAVYQAKDFIDGEPFAVLLADDIIDSVKPALLQMIEKFETCERSILLVMKVPISDSVHYGMIQAKKISEGFYEVEDLIEKPEAIESPSNLAIVGRYILTPAIFDLISRTSEGKGGEIQLTDAIRGLLAKEKVYAYEFEGQRFDVGEKLGFLMANISFALKREDLGKDLKAYLKKLLESL